MKKLAGRRYAYKNFEILPGATHGYKSVLNPITTIMAPFKGGLNCVAY